MQRNNFQGGMVTDASPALQPESSYRLALNASPKTDKHKSFGLVNERSTREITGFPGQERGRTYIEQIHATLIFTYTGASELWLFDHADETLTAVATDTEFGCDWKLANCEFIYAEVKKHTSCNDLLAFFSSGCEFFVVNLTEMLSPVRKQAVKDCETCEYFTTFSDVCRPFFLVQKINRAGSTMEGGAVSFVVRYEDSDGNQSNWFTASRTIYLGTANNAPGEPATNAARLILIGTDESYRYVTIAVVKTSAGVTTAEELETRTLPTGRNLSFTYYGQKGSTINIASLTTTTKAYLRGQDLIQHDGRMFYYNIKNERNVDYQQRANRIRMEWVKYRVPVSVQRQFTYPSFMRGENYAFGIVLNYNDGTYSNAFPIGCQGNTGGKSFSSTSDPFFSGFSSADFDTTDMVSRKRNPDAKEDENSQAHEESLISNIDNYEVDVNDMIAAGACIDSQGRPVCCDANGLPVENPGCTAAQDALTADLSDILKPLRDTMEVLAQMGEDTDAEDVTVGNTTTLREAASYLLSKAVKEREFTTRKRPTFSFTESFGGGGSTEGAKDGGDKGGSDRNDAYSVGGQYGAGVKEVDSGPLTPVFSTLLYPDTKNCGGERMFPTGNICHHRMPTVSEVPHFESRVNGVENQHQPHIDPYGDADIFLLGIRASEVELPSDDEVPKPLCKNNPYSIVYVERTEANSTVMAAGYTTAMFKGDVYGTPHYFPRHGVNAADHVDRSISAGADGTSRMGTPDTSGEGGYNFHSPDTDMAQPFLSASVWRNGLLLKGNGWRYGLYAKGRTPEDAFNGKRTDQRGARVANNLNHYDPAGDSTLPITSLVQAPANTVIADEDGGPSLVNRYREYSTWMKTQGPIPGNSVDGSFTGDVLVHEAPTSANAAYGYLIRPLDDQYGGVHNRMFIRTGIEGRGNSSSVSGISGDVFIGPFSKRRTSYVSNKVGNTWLMPPKPGSTRTERSVCDSGEDTLFELLGFTANTNELPESGDIHDPKNWCGLHTQDGLSPAPSEVPVGAAPRQDYYWPGTLKSLVHVFVESRVNTWHRQHGDERNGQIVYPGLRQVELDSAAPDASPWEDAWLNRFYKPLIQPSRAQIAKIVLIKTILLAIIPAGYLMRIADMTSLMEVVGELFVASGLNAIWGMAVFTLFTTGRMRNMFGLAQCKIDEEGGDLNNEAVQLEDQYNEYNWDYSTQTNYERILGIPRLYNTCDCDDCDSGDEYGRGVQTNGEIYYTNKQNLDSEIDAYRSVRINQYNEMPAHSGHLQRLFIQNGNLYAHTTEGIYTIQLGVGNIPADIGSQLTGAGQLLARPVLMLNTGMSEGFGGTNFPNAAINVPAWGYFFIDNKAGKIYRFNGRPEEISAYGMERFWREHIPFCEDPSCLHDETENRRFVLGWDPAMNLLLVTKKDGPYSFTASYSPEGETGRWVSLHSYAPDRYFWDRSSLFAMNEGKIHEHHTGAGFLNFYGSKYDHFIQGVFVAKDLKYFDLDRVTLLSEASRSGVDGLASTFSHIALWSTLGSTGNRPLKVVETGDAANSQAESIEEDYTQMEAYFRFGEWDITKIHNILDRPCGEGVITMEEECGVIPTIQDNVDCRLLLGQDFERRFLGGRYVHFRFTLSKDNETMLKTYAIDWEGRPERTK